MSLCVGCEVENCLCGLCKEDFLCDLSKMVSEDPTFKKLGRCLACNHDYTEHQRRSDFPSKPWFSWSYISKRSRVKPLEKGSMRKADQD